YAMAPGPQTLLIIHAVIFWWVIPAAFTLAHAEGRSTTVGLAAASLVPLTPLLWPLSQNDFREIQLATPFVVWGVAGVRGRRPWLPTLGVGGMLACRQELALVVATFALLPSREREDVGRSYRWAHVLIVVALAWCLLFLGHLRFSFGVEAASRYLAQ